MAAPKGNQFWKVRSSHGVEAIFTEPDKMWDSACEYFEWVDDNPWEKVETRTKVNGEEYTTTPTERPYTIGGLCVFLGVHTKYLNNFKTTKTYIENKDFADIITRIEEIIYTQKFEGAAVGAFNATIMSRELGLTDKQEITEKASVQIISSNVESDKALSDKLDKE